MDYRKVLLSAVLFYYSFFSTKMTESNTAKILVVNKIELRTKACIGIKASTSDKTRRETPITIQ